MILLFNLHPSEPRPITFMGKVSLGLSTAVLVGFLPYVLVDSYGWIGVVLDLFLAIAFGTVAFVLRTEPAAQSHRSALQSTIAKENCCGHLR